MSFVQKDTVSITTDAAGAATAYSRAITGKLVSVHYVKDGSTPFADGVDFAITNESNGQGVWTEANVNASKIVAPRQPTHDQVGVAALHAAGGTAVGDKLAFAGERAKVVIAQGGDTKTGAITFVWE